MTATCVEWECHIFSSTHTLTQTLYIIVDYQNFNVVVVELVQVKWLFM
jgi:hypothetical protein